MHRDTDVGLIGHRLESALLWQHFFLLDGLLLILCHLLLLSLVILVQLVPDRLLSLFKDILVYFSALSLRSAIREAIFHVVYWNLPKESLQSLLTSVTGLRRRHGRLFLARKRPQDLLTHGIW